MAEPSPPLRRAASVAVGLFALWQMVFLVADNAIDFVPRRPAPTDINPNMRLYQEYGSFTRVEPLQRAVDVFGNALDFWAEVTGQEQGWSLFAPGFPPHSIFPAVEFRFPDGSSETLRSRFEPTDLTALGVRAPLIHNRAYSYEIQFAVAGWVCTEEGIAARPDVWSKMPESVRDGQRHTLAWLKWRLRAFEAANPGRGTPSEVVLKFRYIPTPLPNEPRGWTKPITERPYARWKPGETPEPGYLPVEGYDPVAKQFVRIKPETGP